MQHSGKRLVGQNKANMETRSLGKSAINIKDYGNMHKPLFFIQFVANLIYRHFEWNTNKIQYSAITVYIQLWKR